MAGLFVPAQWALMPFPAATVFAQSIAHSTGVQLWEHTPRH